jgi:glycosyltransferase involved in cell wall biosynthesis
MSTMSVVPNIYVIVSKLPTLALTSGDQINEIMLCCLFSRFAHVYYNDQFFDPKVKGFGLNRKKVSIPQRKYDLYYIRNNYEIWKNVPNPKVWVAVPYFKNTFEESAAIGIYTKVWRDHLLKNHITLRNTIYHQNISSPKKVLYLPQANFTRFSPKQNHEKTLEIRKKIGGDFIIGYFGKVSKSCFPYSMINILPKLKEKFKDKKITYVVGGRFSFNKEITGGKILPFISNFQMPYYLCACDVIVCSYFHPQCNYAGSRHTIEAMSCGVPIIMGDFLARKEIVGEDYPLFWENKKANSMPSIYHEEYLMETLSKLITDKPYYQEIKNYLLKNSIKYSPNAVTEILKDQVLSLIKGKPSLLESKSKK